MVTQDEADQMCDTVLSQRVEIAYHSTREETNTDLVLKAVLIPRLWSNEIEFWHQARQVSACSTVLPIMVADGVRDQAILQAQTL